RAGRAARRRLTRARPPTADEWAALLDAISSELRTGASLAAALQQSLLRTRPRGTVITPSSSLASLTAAHATPPDEAVVLQAVGAAHAVGGPMAATIDAASTLLRERAAIRGEALAHSAQARLSARVLTAVPIVFATWSMASSRSFRTALLSPIGLSSACLGGLCNLLGWWWMRRIVHKAFA
ncbi:MAG: type II secretion system F family protein, partial [Ilumatobacteraceae bacterium]